MVSHRLGAKPVRQPAANCAAVQATQPASATAPSSQNRPLARAASSAVARGDKA